MDGGFELRERNGHTVTFGRKTFVVGDLAGLRVPPQEISNSRDDQWFASDAYMALFYAALGNALPGDFNGKIRLCTGLPQALYNEHTDALRKLLARSHCFRVDGTKYKVLIRSKDLFVMQQVMGLFLSRLEKDRSLQVQRVALIDVGTYTSDWTIIEDLGTVQWASGGMPVGIANVIRRVDEYLKKDLNMECTDAAINDGIRKREILSGNQVVPLGEQIDLIVRECAEPVVEAVCDKWQGAKDAKIIVGGGGGQMFAPAIRLRLPHAEVITDREPIYSIVDGFYTYLDQRRKQKVAA